MKYVILSKRLGVPGETYTPLSQAEARRLVDGGFIAASEEVSTKKPAKGRKVKPDTTEENSNGN